MRPLQVAGIRVPGVTPTQAAVAPMQSGVIPTQSATQTTSIDLNAIINLMMVIMIMKMMTSSMAQIAS